jgi:hypothetical protein
MKMKTTKEIEQSIMNITAIIHQKYPELLKYMDEMPIIHSDDAEINRKNLWEYYNSLKTLKEEYAKTHRKEHGISDAHLYPPEEDIYRNLKEEKDVDPEDPTKNKAPNLRNDEGDGLDVPGAELDDQQESVGSEDEENNYYSLGGDNHNDLEENKG